jgi:hypothetical protein
VKLYTYGAASRSSSKEGNRCSELHKNLIFPVRGLSSSSSKNFKVKKNACWLLGDNV